MGGKKKFKWLAIMVAIMTVICIQSYYAGDVKAEEQHILPATVEKTETFVSSNTVLQTPCRVVDTRNAGGYFYPGETRTYILGSTPAYNIIPNQGGASACNMAYPSVLAGGAIINVTAVPVSGGNYFTVWPYGVTMPLSSVVNYLSGHGPIANAFTVEVYALYWGGYYEPYINVYNGSYGTAHLVIDVMGYLY